MPDQSTLDHYRRRLAQEQDLARKADFPSVRAIHLELALSYAQLIEVLERRLSASARPAATPGRSPSKADESSPCP